MKRKKLDQILFNGIIKNLNLFRKCSLSNKIILDKSILTPDQIDYVNNRIDIEKFVTDHKDFSRKAFTYLEKKEWILKRHKLAIDLFQDTINEKTDQLFSSVFNESVSQIQN